MLSFALLFAMTISNSIYAQNQSQSQSSSNASLSNSSHSIQNQTTAKLTGQPQTTAINQTTIPAQQTTVQVNKTTMPVNGQNIIKPIENQSIQQQQPVNLSNIQNNTMVQPTGPATITIVNKTTVPFNQTTTEGGNISAPQQNQSASQQSSQSSQLQSHPQQSLNQSQQNQSKGPIEQLGQSIGKMFGGK